MGHTSLRLIAEGDRESDCNGHLLLSSMYNNETSRAVNFADFAIFNSIAKISFTLYNNSGRQ